MSARVSATTARVRFGEVLRRVADHGETLVVERGGVPQAVIVPVEEWKRLTEDRRRRRRLTALADVVALREEWRKRGALLIDTTEEIRKGREERDAEIDAALR